MHLRNYWAKNNSGIVLKSQYWKLRVESSFWAYQNQTMNFLESTWIICSQYWLDEWAIINELWKLKEERKNGRHRWANRRPKDFILQLRIQPIHMKWKPIYLKRDILTSKHKKLYTLVTECTSAAYIWRKWTGLSMTRFTGKGLLRKKALSRSY